VSGTDGPVWAGGPGTPTGGAAASWRVETLAITAGREVAPGAPLNVPPVLASTYRDGGAIGYGRFGNPSWSAFEQALGSLEGGHAVAFASGQAATAALLSRLALGAAVVVPASAYVGTRGLLAQLELAGRLVLRPVDICDTEAATDLLDGAALIWLESPTNPLLGVADLPSLLAAARRAGATSVVDNTFATPLLQRPLALGADAVVHSATKYLGGHSDLLLGAAVCAREDLRDELVAHRTGEGAIPGVMEAFLALRGLRTLPVRLERQQQSAQVLAERLSGHPAVVRVRYPGLSGDPGHERALAQMSGPGAMISFELASGELADRLVSSLSLIVATTSLGGVESTIDRRRRWPGEEDVAPGLLRFSVGLEHVEDLWRDLEEGLARLPG
jgi:cystathionine gamma-synthase